MKFLSRSTALSRQVGMNFLKNLLLFKFTKMPVKIKNSNGVALVAVLAILVVLTILAASFSAMMDLELKQSTEQRNSYQLDMLVDAGREHAKTLLTTIEQTANLSELSRDNFSKWIYVKDKTGKVAGRYRLRIEDEAGKVNISKAYLLKEGKGSSWDTGEVVLPKALGLPTQFAKSIIRYKYGANWMPGGRDDDDRNNVVLMADGIDNDADGHIDEEDEGMNDPREYSPENLRGDDRKFTTMSEALSILLNPKKKLTIKQQSAIKNTIPNRATIYSLDKPGSPTLYNEKPADINAVTAREAQKRLSAANAKNIFEPDYKKRTQLAANMVDYRDENHVLSTLGSTYGVEAICFNEVLANEESITYNMIHSPSCDESFTWYLDANTVEKYFRNYLGVTDGERTQYSPSFPYVTSPFIGWNTFDPRKAWRIRNEENEKECGEWKPGSGSIKIELPPLPGNDGYGNYKSDAEFENFYRGASNNKYPDKIDGLPSWNRCFCWGEGQGDDLYTDLYVDLMDRLKKMGLEVNGHPKLPNDFFKGSYAIIYGWGLGDEGNQGHPYGCFEVKSSREGNKGLSVVIKSTDIKGKHVDFPEQVDLSISFLGWGSCQPVAGMPGVNKLDIYRSRQPECNRYFNVAIDRMPTGWDEKGYLLKKLGVSGRLNGGYSEDKVNKEYTKTWWYNDGKPIRTDANGWFKVLLTSSPNCNWEDDIYQNLKYLRMIAPEVTEMYNASATPISLANWRVICNTGSVASEIGRIKSSSCYDQKLRKNIIDQNPVVHPGGHFYLVNDSELFDYWYGSADGKWGTSRKEEIPVFQMDAERWGITYEIKSTKMFNQFIGDGDRAGMSIILKNEKLDKEVFNLETIMFIDEKESKNPKSWHGFFAPVTSSDIKKKGEIFIRAVEPRNEPRRGSKIMILGMPHSGGIVSLTLKNEYEQICARTVDYGKLEVDELDYTVEKIDPTKNKWIKRSQSSIAGDNERALNRAMKSRRNEKFFIKNGPFGNIGEIRHVTTGDNFERLGGGSADISKSFEAMGAIADAMCSSHIRLESCGDNVSRTGWEEAADEVENSSLRSVTCKNGAWQVDQWKGQTLRFLTGKMRGEKFPVIKNTKNVFTLGDTKAVDVPYSAPNRMSLQPAKGDKFCVGPGYASTFCYTTKGNDESEWTWKNAIHYPGEYNLYIHGLNDAIDTTEFFEENNNASLDVEVWNYKTKSFDKLCNKKRYGKQDSFNAGKIKPKNISSSGDLRIKLISHDVAEKNLEAEDAEAGDAKVDSGGRQTGMAWFNYAVVTPVPVPGRVNINTASGRMLASLPGITQSLAKNIAAGINNDGKAKLKPYFSFGDLFKVKGMTPDIFERCANLLTLDSSFFTIDVEAEVLKINPPLKRASGNVSTRKKITPNEIAGIRRKRFIIELNKADDGYASINEIEQYSP